MRTPEAIANEVIASVGGKCFEDPGAVLAVKFAAEQAQREAWNEAIETAVAKIEGFGCPTLFKRVLETIRSLIRRDSDGR